MAENEKQGTLPPTPSIKSIVEGFLFTESAYMELTKEKLKELVEKLEKIRIHIDDMLCHAVDIAEECHRLSETLEEILRDARGNSLGAD